MSFQFLPNYPQAFGSRQAAVATYQGPNPYLTGGENVTTQGVFGGGSFDKVEGGTSFNSSAAGTYIVRPVYPVGQATIGASGSNNVKMQWVVAANGAEVANNTNLAAEYCRVMFVGG